MTLRKAAQQMLEVLETLNAKDSVFCGEFDNQITALRAALEEPERKPLTEQQLTDIAIKCGCMSADWFDFARAIEQAHGIRELDTQ